MVASYHFSAQIIKRSEGRSAVRFAAYRAGAKLIDERTGRESDFSHRHGVAHTEILAPEGSAAWLRDRQALWNAVERQEKRADAQLAREINMALPHELTDGQRLQLVRDFVSGHFVKHGMVADVAIHRPVPEKGDDPRNHHAHVTLTLRQATKGGLRAVKTREWNSDAMLKQWRRAWADHQNTVLRAHGQMARVDHRTLIEQRRAAKERGDALAAEVLDRLPELHVGPRATNAARRGYAPQSQDHRRGLRKQPRREKAPVERRQAPRPTSAPAGQGRAQHQRTIRYREIDVGSRYQVNRQRIDRNLAAIDRKITRWMDRAARERTRHQQLLRQAYQRRLPAGILRPGMYRLAPLRAPSSPLVRQLEVLLSGLFAEKRRHAVRRAQLARPFQFARTRAGRTKLGRYRARTPW